MSKEEMMLESQRRRESDAEVDESIRLAEAQKKAEEEILNMPGVKSFLEAIEHLNATLKAFEEDYKPKTPEPREE